MAVTVWAVYRDGDYLCAGTPQELAVMMDRPTLADRLAPGKTRAVIGKGLTAVLLLPARKPPRPPAGPPPEPESKIVDFDAQVVLMMGRHGATVSRVAERLGVTDYRVRRALARVRAGRYGDVRKGGVPAGLARSVARLEKET